VTQGLEGNNNISHLIYLKLISVQASIQTSEKKASSKINHLKFGKTAKCIIAIAVIAIILISAFTFLTKQSVSNKTTPPVYVPQNNSTSTNSPTPHSTQDSQPINPNIGYQPGDQGYFPTPTLSKPPGIIEAAPIINSSVWRQVAAAAWAYFQPGTGIEGDTGLPYAGGENFKAFTDWDLGVYIQAIIDAQNISLISSSDAYSRLDKVLTFLENRPLNSTTNYPFWFYNSENGQGYKMSLTQEDCLLHSTIL
jgi:hypothetical protein